LHLIDDELPDPKRPVIPGHEIVGTVVAHGAGVAHSALLTRVGGHFGHTRCGHCNYCKAGRENLCAEAQFTGYQLDGGYAESYRRCRCAHVFPLRQRLRR
jgi:propanol-preferring alcohol dehydrogenase